MIKGEQLWEKKSSIGGNKKIYEEPKELVIDGQQRLTALVAAMYGIKVRDKTMKSVKSRSATIPAARS